MQRFFIGQIRTEGDMVEIAGEDAHKIRNVLRMQSGDIVTVCDSAANEFRATLEIHGECVQAKLHEKSPNMEMHEPSLRITVAQGIPKGQKMDFIVEKLTELGVATIVPLLTERTVADATPTKLERWNRLAKTAAQQSGRREIPAIQKPTNFADFLSQTKNYDCVIIPWELADRIPLRETLPPLLENARTLAIIVGPEGGFSHAEIDTAQAVGAIPISLGPRILRTETAALALIAVVNFLKER